MITITSIEAEDKKLLAKADVSLPFHGLEPEGRMLVDSDGSAFVYLLAHGEDYVQLRFEEKTWNILNTYHEAEWPIYIKTGIKPVELVDFWTEFEFLLDNIEGNHNYGKEFVEKVEQVFLAERSEG
ncbi:hypothetical protein [Alkalicoccus daliensis]|uniref:Uncharacterized protein n=1 Tax=Alkalicoccus daliensis TaxID=745820 RepID=A0A1G9ZH16_9BACI|nr:hypothetical protein [Alkalicoccus daliensis]SDN20331.1 hypothetical protein SAMN04488053_10191 [Alkalicoccus daliensis]